ncbi:MAG: ABC transporter ATP-binding protein [Actinobacteria bacterium]|nr:ABC transporter ATP-binding protein [Actinomycetota bacterium]
MPTSAISLKGVTKFYGHELGVMDVTFEVLPGEIMGFLGPNGAGKTTTMRALVGLLKLTSGQAYILGEEVTIYSHEMRKEIGYLPGSPGLYENLTGWEHLRFLAKMRDCDCTEEIRSMAERFDLDLHRRIKDLSKGNQQKIGVIQAFMHRPSILILDEPTSGLDPIVQREFSALVDETQSRGAAILLSSHVLSEVEHLADRVVIINDGKQLLVDEISNLKKRTLRTVDLFFGSPIPPEVFSRVHGIKDVHTYGNRITCTVIGAETELLKVAVEHGLESVQTHESNLDEIFFSIVEGGDPNGYSTIS